MNRRQAKVVLLCEDNQHEAFARRFLQRCGIHPRAIRVEKSPRGRGSAEQWVRSAYVREVSALRSAPHITSRALVVLLDEDTKPRNRQLEESLQLSGDPPRSPAEPILHVIPARNIETWLSYLEGEDTSEEKTYNKLARARDCWPAVEALKQMCDRQKLREPVPPSLAAACTEFRSRMPQ